MSDKSYYGKSVGKRPGVGAGWGPDRLADALDLSKEDPQVVARYGTGDEKIHIDENGAPRVPQSFLVARRLVEAGVRFVTTRRSRASGSVASRCCSRSASRPPRDCGG